MHTALVSRILRDPSYWEETTLDEEKDEEKKDKRPVPALASAARLSV